MTFSCCNFGVRTQATIKVFHVQKQQMVKVIYFGQIFYLFFLDCKDFIMLKRHSHIVFYSYY